MLLELIGCRCPRIVRFRSRDFNTLEFLTVDAIKWTFGYEREFDVRNTCWKNSLRECCSSKSNKFSAASRTRSRVICQSKSRTTSPLELKIIAFFIVAGCPRRAEAVLQQDRVGRQQNSRRVWPQQNQRWSTLSG